MAKHCIIQASVRKRQFPMKESRRNLKIKNEKINTVPSSLYHAVIICLLLKWLRFKAVSRPWTLKWSPRGSPGSITHLAWELVSLLHILPFRTTVFCGQPLSAAPSYSFTASECLNESHGATCTLPLTVEPSVSLSLTHSASLITPSRVLLFPEK